MTTTQTANTMTDAEIAEIERIKAMYGLEGEEIVPLTGEEAAEFERLSVLYGRTPFHLFMLEAAKFHGGMASLGGHIDEICKLRFKILKQQEEERNKPYDRHPGFHSAWWVIRVAMGLPTDWSPYEPKVPMVRGLSQYVSAILSKACKRKGVEYIKDVYLGGQKLFPVAVIDEEKLAGLEDKIREYAADKQPRAKILPFAPVRK
jgi:hypothetical protein